MAGKNIFQALNSIDIKDLKNINVDQIKGFVTGKPEALVNIAIVFLTCVAVVQIFSGQKKQSRDLKVEIPILQEKLDVIELGKTAQKEYEDFLGKIPQAIDDDRFIDKISELAVSNDVQILSFSPPAQSTNGNVSLLTIEMDISAEDYENFMSFIGAIENLPFAVKLSQLKASLAPSRPSAKAGEAQKNPIQAHMEVNSVKIKK